MIRSIDKDGTSFYAYTTEKGTNNFICPVCKHDVILKKGKIKIHHFSHKVKSECINQGETQLHLQTKLAVYNHLKANKDVSKLMMERNLKQVIPDVSFLYKGNYIAIEIQHSNITNELINKRMAHYRNKNIFVLWVIPDDIKYIKDQEENCVSPRLWQKHLHTMYFGNIFYIKNNIIDAYKYSGYTLNVPYGEWYEQGGEHIEVGGYDKWSKRYRTLEKKLLNCDILNNFKAVIRPTYKNIPQCKIWTLKN